MGIGVSIFLIAVGAILTFGITLDRDATGVWNLDTIGIILMIVGGIGILLSLIFMSSMPWGGGRREERVVERDRERI